jgi:hypothetical protein
VNHDKDLRLRIFSEKRRNFSAIDQLVEDYVGILYKQSVFCKKNDDNYPFSEEYFTDDA